MNNEVLGRFVESSEEFPAVFVTVLKRKPPKWKNLLRLSDLDAVVCGGGRSTEVLIERLAMPAPTLSIVHKRESPVESHPMEWIITNLWMEKQADLQIIHHWKLATVRINGGSPFEKVFGYGHIVHENHTLSKNFDIDKVT